MEADAHGYRRSTLRSGAVIFPVTSSRARAWPPEDETIVKSLSGKSGEGDTSPSKAVRYVDTCTRVRRVSASCDVSVVYQQ